MELEIVESGKCPKETDCPPVPQVRVVEPMGCSVGGFLIGCCIVHFWCWAPSEGLCC